MSQGLTGQYPQFHDPGDALDHVAEKRLLEKTACFDPEADEINKLLRHVVGLIFVLGLVLKKFLIYLIKHATYRYMEKPVWIVDFK